MASGWISKDVRASIYRRDRGTCAYCGCELHIVQWIDVEANTPEQAAEKATRRAYASLCHECSQEVELGEIIGCQVHDDDGELLLEVDEI